MQRNPVPAIAIALVFSLTACETESTFQPIPISGTLPESTVTVSATVEKVDVAARRLTLRDAAGNSTTMVVPEEVRNLPQVQVGDEVVVAYQESMAYEVKKPGEATPGVTVAAAAGRAAPGEKPAAGAATAITMSYYIESIDRRTPSVTLRRPDGQRVTVKVWNAWKLDHVAVGDLVEITYTEAVVASVQPKDKK